MARNYAPLFHEYLEEMESLNDAEFGRLCRALLEYSIHGTPIALSGNERFFAKRIMMQEDRARESYDAAVEQRRAAAKASAAKRSSTTVNETSKYKSNQNHIDNTTPNGVGIKARFTPPTTEEVSAYCRERGNAVDPERFVDFYASKGWKVGSQPMKDWKAAVRTWEQRDKPTKKAGRDDSWMDEYL